MKMQKAHAVFLTLMVSLVFSPGLRAQDVTNADRLYEAENWEDASRAYEAIAERETTNARAWYRLGVCLRHLGRYDDAADALGRAVEEGTPLEFAGYQFAAVHALRGEEELAFEWLDKAIEAGFSGPELLRTDDAFVALQRDERFQAALHRADVNSRPCELLPEYGELGFWVGDWDVFSAGRHAGTNTIQSLVQGCVLLENWISASGGTGKSFNYYDPSKKKWIQDWVDSEGGVIHAEGGLRDGSMILQGTHVYRNGTQEPFRMTFTPLEDGSVRQFIEQSKDEGKTWYVWFDGTYTKRN